MAPPTIRITALVLPLALGGCAGFRMPVEQPTVQVRSVAIGAASRRGMDARLELDLYNPNLVGLPVSRVDWNLQLGGGRLIDGQTTLTENLAARGTAPVAVVLHIAALDAVALAPRLSAGATDYWLEGTLHFDTSYGDLAVDFHREGDLVD